MVLCWTELVTVSSRMIHSGDHRTLLMSAARGGHVVLVRALVRRYHADPTDTDVQVCYLWKVANGSVFFIADCPDVIFRDGLPCNMRWLEARGLVSKRFLLRS